MISAMISREFGWGINIAKEKLETTNATRLGQAYKDGESAKEKRGTAIKSPLTCSIFIREFEYESKGEGYWSYEHMVIQLEDCIDCLKVLYPQYDFAFLLDHSCGYDRQREVGLNAGKTLLRMCVRETPLIPTVEPFFGFIDAYSGYHLPYLCQPSGPFIP